MIKNYIKVDASTGEILKQLTCIEEIARLQETEGTLVIEGDADDLLDYYDTSEGNVKSRPDMGVTFTSNKTRARETGSITIMGVPENSEIVIKGMTVEYDEIFVADGTDIDLKFYDRGKYRIRIIKHPFKDVEEVIHAD